MTTQPKHLDATTYTWHKPPAPRVFRIHFDRSKLKSQNPMKRQEYQEWNEVEGVQFTNGAIALDREYTIVNFFNTLTDMCDYFGTLGKYEIAWEDEESELPD
jgi:hypothetical protein